MVMCFKGVVRFPVSLENTKSFALCYAYLAIFVNKAITLQSGRVTTKLKHYTFINCNLLMNILARGL